MNFIKFKIYTCVRKALSARKAPLVQTAPSIQMAPSMGRSTYSSAYSLWARKVWVHSLRAWAHDLRRV